MVSDAAVQDGVVGGGGAALVMGVVGRVEVCGCVGVEVGVCVELCVELCVVVLADLDVAGELMEPDGCPEWVVGGTVDLPSVGDDVCAGLVRCVRVDVWVAIGGVGGVGGLDCGARGGATGGDSVAPDAGEVVGLGTDEDLTGVGGSDRVPVGAREPTVVVPGSAPAVEVGRCPWPEWRFDPATSTEPPITDATSAAAASAGRIRSGTRPV